MNSIILALSCLSNISPNSTILETPCSSNVQHDELRKFWSPTNRLTLSRNYEKHIKEPPNTKMLDPSALFGKKIRIAVVDEKPYVTQVFKNKSITGVSRVMIDLFREKLGFDWEIVFPTDNTVGNCHNGQCTGVMKLLDDNEADLAMTFVSMTPDRMPYVKFSTPLGDDRLVIMMRRESETSAAEAIVAPFQLDVWIYFAISCILFAPIMYAIIRFRAYLCKNDEDLGLVYTLREYYWFSYIAVIKQGYTRDPKADSTRILLIFWLLFNTILSNFYTANLIAFFTTSRLPIPFRGLYDISLADQWRAVQGGTIESIVLAENVNSTAGTKYPLWPEFDLLRENYFANGANSFLQDDNEDFTQLVRKRNYLYLDENEKIDRMFMIDYKLNRLSGIPHKRSCSFIKSPDSIATIPYGLAFSKSFEMKPLFDIWIQKLSEAGFFYAWKNDGLPKWQPCSSTADTQAAKKLGNADLALTYSICGILLALATISFIFENLIGRLLTKRKMGVENEKTLLNEYEQKYFNKHKLLDNSKHILGNSHTFKTKTGEVLNIPPLYYRHEYGNY